MMGSLAKTALEKGIAKDKDFCGRDAAAVAAVISQNLASTTKEFEAIEVLVVEPFTRPVEKPGCVVEAVMKARHITRRADGTLLARQLACNTCLEGEDRVCPTCTSLPPSYSEVEEQHAATQDEEEQEQDQHIEGGREDPHGLVGEVDGAEEAGDEREEEEEVTEKRGEGEEEEEQAEPGDLYWARESRRQYWPCQAVLPLLVPAADRARAGTVASDSTWVRMLGEGRGEYKPLPPWALVPLQPGSPFDLGAVGEDQAKLAAYNVALCTRLGW